MRVGSAPVNTFYDGEVKMSTLETLPLWPDVGRDILKLSRNAAYVAAKRGQIPSIRIGGAIRVPVDALRRLLDGADKVQP